MKNQLTKLLLAMTFVAVSSAYSGENLWVYTQGTDTRPQHSWELKYGHIARIDKDSGNYQFHDIRPEIEYGITDRLTVGIEGMFFYHKYEDVEWAPMVDTQGEDGKFHKFSAAGVEATAKYNLLSPYKDWLGLSLGLSYEYRQKYRLDGADIQQHSWVPMLFLQKNWLDDTLVWSFKGKMELERRTSPGVLEEEIAFDLATGLSYRVAPRWFVGLEARWQSDFLSPEEDGVAEGRRSSWDWNDWTLGDQFQWGLYVGPSIHYATEKWWVTLGALHQVAGWSADGPEASREGRNWDEHERWHIGLTIGYEFGGDDDVPEMFPSKSK